MNTPDQHSIHPFPQPRARLARKRNNHRQNHEARAATNRARSANKANPTWHGEGSHAGLKHRTTKRKTQNLVKE